MGAIYPKKLLKLILKENYLQGSEPGNFYIFIIYRRIKAMALIGRLDDGFGAPLEFY